MSDRPEVGAIASVLQLNATGAPLPSPSTALEVAREPTVCSARSLHRARASICSVSDRAAASIAPQMERVFENRGSAIPMSAVTFSPRYSISLRLPCDASRAQRGRNPALLRVHLQTAPVGRRCRTVRAARAAMASSQEVYL
jgi:hypothetical protein